MPQGRVRELRIHTALPVRVTWAGEGKMTTVSACTIDVSQRGARLTGAAGLKGSGQLIAIRRKASEAQFKVIWIGGPQTPHEGQVGVECVDADKIIWDVDFGKVHEDFEPFTGNLKPSDIPSSRYRCEGRVLIWPEQGTVGGFEAQLQFLGLSFCEIKGATAFQGPLLLQIYTEDAQLTVKGSARKTMHEGGTWVDFTEIRRGDRQELQNLVSRLSGKKNPS
jgi:hypothetical protein